MSKTNYTIPRWKDCAECGAAMEQEPGRGKARKHCSEACFKEAARKRKLLYPPCELDGCDKPSRTQAGGLCEMHYYRRYLTGDVGCVEPKCGTHNHCVYCGVETDGMKYCSSRCATRDSRGHPITRECPICGSEYSPMKTVHGRDRLVCSDACDRAKKNLAIALRRGRAGERLDAIDPHEVFRRDGYTCQECGKHCKPQNGKERSPDDAQVDHIIPVILGGTHTWGNVQTLCLSCNARKGAKMPEWVDERQPMLKL